ncbi:MAG: hypothetical protein PUF49_05960 [Firmicutes bacterium]|nr:hypothetical protein [Bacillota bacterium]
MEEGSRICEIQTLTFSRDNATEILTELFGLNLISDARISNVDLAVKNVYNEGGITILKRCEITMRTKLSLAGKVVEIANARNRVMDPVTTVTELRDTSVGYYSFVDRHVSCGEKKDHG